MVCAKARWMKMSSSFLEYQNQQSLDKGNVDEAILKEKIFQNNLLLKEEMKKATPYEDSIHISSKKVNTEKNCSNRSNHKKRDVEEYV